MEERKLCLRPSILCISSNRYILIPKPSEASEGNSNFYAFGTDFASIITRPCKMLLNDDSGKAFVNMSAS